MATVTVPDTGSHNLAAVLESLHAEAEHKASLRMYFAAADLCRNYHGAFAAETQPQRTQWAADYEKLGIAAEQERKAHGGPFIPHPAAPHPAAPHATGHWHCPACHAAFPESLVVCGKCGFDLRTGKAYQADGSKPKPLPRFWVGNTKVTRTHHLGRARHREDKTLSLVIWGTAVGMIVLLVVLVICKRELAPPPGANPTPRPVFQP